MTVIIQIPYESTEHIEAISQKGPEGLLIQRCFSAFCAIAAYALPMAAGALPMAADAPPMAADALPSAVQGYFCVFSVFSV